MVLNGYMQLMCCAHVVNRSRNFPFYSCKIGNKRKTVSKCRKDLGPFVF